MCLCVFVREALSLAMGVILYISAVNDEVAHRKKTESASDRVFSYRYGWAFFFGAATFMCTMVAAVSNISLYLHRYAYQEDFTLLQLNDGPQPSSAAAAVVVKSTTTSPAARGAGGITAAFSSVQPLMGSSTAVGSSTLHVATPSRIVSSTSAVDFVSTNHSVSVIL